MFELRVVRRAATLRVAVPWDAGPMAPLGEGGGQRRRSVKKSNRRSTAPAGTIDVSQSGYAHDDDTDETQAIEVEALESKVRLKALHSAL